MVVTVDNQSIPMSKASAERVAKALRKEGVTAKLELHEELARERAAHELTRRALARAYDTIAAIRRALGGVQP